MTEEEVETVVEEPADTKEKIEEIDTVKKAKPRRKQKKAKSDDEKEALEEIFGEDDEDLDILTTIPDKELNEVIKIIDLPEKTTRDSKWVKKDRTKKDKVKKEKVKKDKVKKDKSQIELDKKKRKLSKKGLGLVEKIKEKKQKEAEVKFVDDTSDKQKKSKRRKRAKKKKIDVKEIDASIKETMSKMEESSKLKKYKKKTKDVEVEEETNVINVTEFISVSELAKLMDEETTDVITKCLGLGVIATINQRLDMDTISAVADEFGFEVNQIEEMEDISIEIEEEDPKFLEERPPVVTIMGHVDHGKTSLLDYIRESNVVAGEKGGITQHIGAYEVEISNKKITFLDTPGHEAFTAMRARGAQLTDIVVIVVASDDNVMPQTLEAINHAQAANVPIIFGINKIDKPEANVENIKKQLSDNNILVESWGGKYQSVEISAKSGIGVDDLLENILFQAELLELKANPAGRVKGVVVESRMEKGRGTVCTLLVQNGTYKIGDFFVCGQYFGRVKAMFNERSKKIKNAPPSTPVQVLGFSGMPQAGDILIGMDSEKEAKRISNKRQNIKRQQESRKKAITSLYDISEKIKAGSIKELLLIIKGDTDGSIGALEDSFSKISTDEVDVRIIHKSIGAITETDVLLASASNAIIIGFHVRPNLKAREVAEHEKVDIRLYDVIYDAIEEVKAALEGLLEPEISEDIESTVEIRDVFKIPKIGTIAGSYVVSGKVHRNAKCRLIREGIVIYDGIVESLKRFKEDTKEVATGFECGIGLDKFNDIKVGDIIETYKVVETKRVLK
ncbi:translation initiation factor IF-2 [candidate division KSB1 bacterium]